MPPTSTRAAVEGAGVTIGQGGARFRRQIAEGSAKPPSRVQGLDSREQSIAGGGQITEYEVARLLAADIEPAAAHPAQNIAIADLGPLQRQALAFQIAFEAEVAHHRGDQGVLGQAALLAQCDGQQAEDLVAVDDLALLVADDDPVGVTVQRNADIGPVQIDRRAQRLRIGRAAIGIDVQAIGLDAQPENLGAQLIKRGRRDAVPGPVGAVDHDS